MSRSEYYISLSADVKTRYDEKLKIIDNVDPYALSDVDLSLNLTLLPPVTIVDLMNYLILTHSFYTGKQLKAYKSLQAYKYYEAGFVHKVLARKINSNYVVVGRVMHSQRRREKPLLVWIVLVSDGAVSTGHCTCMAGLGEVCSHVAAVLFFLEARPTQWLDDQVACTELLARWPVPANKGVDMVRIRDMDWAKKAKPVCGSALSVTPLEGDDLVNLIRSLQNMGIEPAVARIQEPFASEMVKVPLQLPGSFRRLFKEEFVSKPYEELLVMSKSTNIRSCMKYSDEEIQQIEVATRGQALISIWFEFRAGRITASKFKATSRSRIEKPSLSLLKGICYPQKMVFYSKQTTYGIKNESQALQKYLDCMRNHEGVKLEKAGFLISKEHPEVGASPDGLVSCTCHGPGCVEVKCPYLLKKMTLSEYADKKTSCLVKISEDTYSLDRNHLYFYQVQLQMYVTNLKYCDFVIWSKKDLVIERIYFDEEFCKVGLKKSLDFHQYIIMPELLGRYFTCKEGLQKVKTWCFCKTVDDGRPMLRCDNEECDLEWFHFDCVGLIEIPENIWFCPNCL